MVFVNLVTIYKAMKTALLLLLFVNPFAVADTTQPTPGHTFINRLLKDPTSFIYTPKPDKVTPERKHQIILNLMGSTPLFGLEYSYRVWETKRKRITLETGLGLGLMSFEKSYFKTISDNGGFPLNVSHHVRALFFRNSIITPYVGYYGILISGGNFSNDYSSYYRPNFGAGFRIGDSDIFAMQIGATAYINCCTSGRDPIGGNRYYTWVLPSFSFHIPLGAK